MMPYMRTTLTLDNDLAAKLKEYAGRSGISFKEAVNTILRRGFGSQSLRSGNTPRYEVPVFESEFRPGVDSLKLNQLLDDLDAEEALGSGK